MKRFHVHVAVSDLIQSTRFYSAMFGAEPSVTKPDYAKWMLDDPKINFAISLRNGETGVNHLGFQAESADELEEIHTRLQSANTAIAAEKGVDCCYAKSDKYWVEDPAGIAWESFRSLDTVPFFGDADPAPNKESLPAPAGEGCATSCCPAIPAAEANIKTAAKACCNG